MCSSDLEIQNLRGGLTQGRRGGLKGWEGGWVEGRVAEREILFFGV